jgi:hypothetical protein
MGALKKHTEASKEEIDKVVASADNIKVHEDGDIILMDSLEEKKKKKKPCKPSKGKRFAKRVNGKCRSFGQKGKQRAVEIALGPEQLRVMHIVRDQQRLKNVKTLLAQMPCLVKSGSVADLSL